MINTNTNRWQSVRLLFDKHIIGGNLKSNQQWQQSSAFEEEAELLQHDGAAGVIRTILAQLFHVSLTGTLNDTPQERQSGVQVDIKSSSSSLAQGELFI